MPGGSMRGSTPDAFAARGFDFVLMVTTLGASVRAAERNARDRLFASLRAAPSRASSVVAACATPSVAGDAASIGAASRSTLAVTTAERFAIRAGRIGCACRLCMALPFLASSQRRTHPVR